MGGSQSRGGPVDGVDTHNKAHLQQHRRKLNNANSKSSVSSHPNAKGMPLVSARSLSGSNAQLFADAQGQLSDVFIPQGNSAIPFSTAQAQQGRMPQQGPPQSVASILEMDSSAWSAPPSSISPASPRPLPLSPDETFRLVADYDTTQSPSHHRQPALVHAPPNSLSSACVRPPTSFVSSNASSSPSANLIYRKGELVRVLSRTSEWCEVERLPSSSGIGSSSTTGSSSSLGSNRTWVPATYLTLASPLDRFLWYQGSISRLEAEGLLSSGINGCFLVRDSESCPGQLSISVRCECRVYHYRIHQDPSGFYYITTGQKFFTVEDLVKHHSQFPDGLVCTLIYPAPKQSEKKLHKEFGSSSNILSSLSSYPSEIEYIMDTATGNWEVDRTEIIMEQRLGGGQYGDVYVARWKRKNQIVAVKTLKEDTMGRDDFLSEANIMMKMQHPNLVQLLGVCTREPPYYIITEYMRNGNLLDMLRRSNRADLPPLVLLDMATQISAGMAFLEAKHFIHRDLAARNCLVGEQVNTARGHKSYIVKVADFGLARLIREQEQIYTAKAGAKFPIKWTAPEGLAYNKFSTKSDVWAFGILLWELATYGMTPYPSVELTEVYRLLDQGYRMEKPKGCPDAVYHTMLECWKWHSDERPSFSELNSRLSVLCEQGLFDEESSERAEEGTLDSNYTTQFFPTPIRHTPTPSMLSAVSDSSSKSAPAGPAALGLAPVGHSAPGLTLAPQSMAALSTGTLSDFGSATSNSAHSVNSISASSLNLGNALNAGSVSNALVPQTLAIANSIPPTSISVAKFSNLSNSSSNLFSSRPSSGHPASTGPGSGPGTTGLLRVDIPSIPRPSARASMAQISPDSHVILSSHAHSNANSSSTIVPGQLSSRSSTSTFAPPTSGFTTSPGLTRQPYPLQLPPFAPQQSQEDLAITTNPPQLQSHSHLDMMMQNLSSDFDSSIGNALSQSHGSASSERDRDRFVILGDPLNSTSSSNANASNSANSATSASTDSVSPGPFHKVSNSAPMSSASEIETLSTAVPHSRKEQPAALRKNYGYKDWLHTSGSGSGSGSGSISVQSNSNSSSSFVLVPGPTVSVSGSALTPLGETPASASGSASGSGSGSSSGISVRERFNAPPRPGSTGANGTCMGLRSLSLENLLDANSKLHSPSNSTRVTNLDIDIGEPRHDSFNKKDFSDHRDRFRGDSSSSHDQTQFNNFARQSTGPAPKPKQKPSVSKKPSISKAPLAQAEAAATKSPSPTLIPSLTNAPLKSAVTPTSSTSTTPTTTASAAPPLAGPGQLANATPSQPRFMQQMSVESNSSVTSRLSQLPSPRVPLHTTPTPNSFASPQSQASFLRSNAGPSLTQPLQQSQFQRPHFSPSISNVLTVNSDPEGPIMRQASSRPGGFPPSPNSGMRMGEAEDVPVVRSQRAGSALGSVPMGAQLSPASQFAAQFHAPMRSVTPGPAIASGQNFGIGLGLPPTPSCLTQSTYGQELVEVAELADSPGRQRHSIHVPHNLTLPSGEQPDEVIAAPRGPPKRRVKDLLKVFDAK